ncbi:MULTISPECIES: N(5)-hydroxyornithine transformylase PvdF [Betaproteobacteria]|jgi:folate-dependent phosphoribosylglycinamide formyltransferase PurN|uniref:phosphoribosylglycinamide formyltransferase 1 n=1 Tax=Acidovorax facilis TaxID=12917 RepID=A0ABV8DBZ8_9BURK|nr:MULTISPECIES: N(5)-hydroxyornithine transformylase PvdF [Acidovorax]KQB57528.1 N(5)-hydroxyornithine transformylase PvdF [Acidovorax sp. SD340]MBO1007978.1 N(5)-hydroxyornithine transformylase PvdF [Acidovorax sp. SD340]MCO4241497.1 N(5)-hydroxyornithine transformylase PvdF [Acidovorax facilis]
MAQKRLVYIWSLRNAAADKAGQHINYKAEARYMPSPLEHLVTLLNEGPLGEHLVLDRVIFDDDEGSPADRAKLADYGFTPRPGGTWFYPPGLAVQGRALNDLLTPVPSTYRRLPLNDPRRASGKHDFEERLLAALSGVQADVVVLDGLLVILDELVRPGAPFARRIYNIHPGITRDGSPHQRRGAYATLDALHGARGKKVVNWQTMEYIDVPVVRQTGASFHFVDNGIDSGEVVADVLATDIDPEDTILELRWNNFHRSLFPALEQGLAKVLGVELGVAHAC